MMGCMRIPGPSTLFAAAESLKDGVTEIKDGVTEMVFDIPGTLTQVMDLLHRTTVLVDRAEVLLTRAEGMVERGEVALAAAESMVRDGESVLDGAAGVLADAEEAAGGAQLLTLRADALMAPFEELSTDALPLAEDALPIATRVVKSTDLEEVEAVVGMINHLPQLLEHLESDIMPLLGKLDRVGPDVHDILDGVQGITTALSGIPGVSLLMRRGDRLKDKGQGLAHEAAHEHEGERDAAHALPGRGLNHPRGE